MQGCGVPEANRNPCRVWRQSKNIETVFTAPAIELAGLYGTQDTAHQFDTGVRIVRLFTENRSKNRFGLSVFLLRPEHRRRIAYLKTLPRIAVEQVIQGSGVGEGGKGADRGVVALLLIKGSECFFIEGRDVCPCGLGIPDVFYFRL